MANEDRRLTAKAVRESNERALEIVRTGPELDEEARRSVCDLYFGYGPALFTQPIPERSSPAEKRLLMARRDQFFTPPYLGTFLANLLQIPRGASVYDPAAGSGRMFFEVAGLNRRIFLTGIEIDPEACSVARALLGENAFILNGDLVDCPATSPLFSYCLGSPPMTAVSLDRHGRYKARNEQGNVLTFFVFLENAAMALEPGGIMGVIVPNGWRGGGVPPLFGEWFDERMRCLLEMPICGDIFITPDSGIPDRISFAIEVYLKGDPGITRPDGAITVRCPQMYGEADLKRLASFPTPGDHGCRGLRLFEQLYRGRLQDLAGRARRGLCRLPISAAADPA